MNETYTTLRNKIAAYMGRNATDFTFSSVDCLKQAINNAKDFCQRTIDFEKARAFAQVNNVSLLSGGLLTNAVLFGTSTSVMVKSVEHAWLGDSNSQYPIDILTRDEWVQRKLNLARNGNYDESPVSAPAMVIVGDTFFIDQGAKSLDATFTVYLDIIRWLGDFDSPVTGSATATVAGKLRDATKNFITLGVKAGDLVFNDTDSTSTTIVSVAAATDLELSADIFASGEKYTVGTTTASNFLLDYCFDYLLFRCIAELNFFLKEDPRFVISEKVLDATWKNVVAWNASIIGNTASVAGE